MSSGEPGNAVFWAMGMIREATASDLPRLVEMGRNFIAQTKYKDLIYGNSEQMTLTLEGLIGNPSASFLVAESGAGELVGMIGAIMYVHPISGEVTANEIVWWVEPAHRGIGISLLRHIERWTQGAEAALNMVAPDEKTARIYKALGYELIETVYQRRFQ